MRPIRWRDVPHTPTGDCALCTPLLREIQKQVGIFRTPLEDRASFFEKIVEKWWGGAMILLCLLLPLLTGCTTLAGGQLGANQIAAQPAPRVRLTYVAIGASDTFGIGADDPQTQNWPADLAARLGPGVHLINLGIPFMVAHQALRIELPVALDAHPQLVTIWLAVNDLIDNIPVASYQHDLDLLLTRLQAGAPHAIIIMANVPDITLLPRFRSVAPGPLEAKIQAYNNAIASIAVRHHVLLVDLYQIWRELAATHPEYISGDGFHPSTLGYAQLANLFYQVLQRNDKHRL